MALLHELLFVLQSSAAALPPECKPLNLPTKPIEKQRVHPATGKIERVFVNLEAVYPDPDNPNHEMSLEELRAMRRGWMDQEWVAQRQKALKEKSRCVARKDPISTTKKIKGDRADKSLSTRLNDKLKVNDRTSQAGGSDVTAASRDQKSARAKKITILEVKAETQTSKYDRFHFHGL
jgi:checkpoint serine/threonine-protein kinase